MTLKEYKLWVAATMEALQRTDSLTLEEALFIIAKLDDVSAIESFGTPIPTLPSLPDPITPNDIWQQPYRIPVPMLNPLEIICGDGAFTPGALSDSVKTVGYATFPSNVYIQECAALEFGKHKDEADYSGEF